MEQLVDLRKVADILQNRGVDDQTLRALCFDNYARCLKVAMGARSAP
jgi:predicted metal-dependent phosphotriesterase family hydrolase